jgi:hypothetical protein
LIDRFICLRVLVLPLGLTLFPQPRRAQPV